MLKYILYIILFYLLYRMIKNALTGTKKNDTVKGQAKEDQSIQEKHKDKIEDAEFEDIE